MMDSLPSDEIESSPPPNPLTITTTTSIPIPGDDNQPSPIPQQQDLPTQNPSSPLPDSHSLQTLESADPDPPNQDPDIHHLQDDPDDPEGMPITLISDSNVEEREIEIEALPPSSSSRRAPTRRKKGSVKNHPRTLAAVEKKVHALTQKWKVIPFVRNKALDFSRHEENLRRLGLWEFAHFEFDRKIRFDLLAKLIVTYNSKERCSFVDGFKVRVTPTDLARALCLSKKPKPADSGEEEEVWPEDFLAFLAEFVSNWMLLHEDTWILPKEVMNWTGMIKEGQPEKVDWTKLIWFMVRREVSQGPEMENCYYASHLQQLIKFQRKELFREKSPMEVQEVIMLKEDEDEKGDVKMAECEVSHGGEPEMKLENVQPSVGGIGSVQSEQSAENVVNLGVLGNVSDAENVCSLAHGDITIGCVGGVENPETAGGHVENLEKAVEHLEIPEKAVERVGSPEKLVERVGSSEKAVERVESLEKSVERMGSPEKAVERMGSPEKAVEDVESPEKVVEPVESLEKAVEHVEIPEAVEHVEVPETAVEHVEIPETAVENVEKAVEHVEILDKPVENVEKAVEHVENLEKAVDQEENVEIAVDQMENMATVGDHAVNLDNTGGHADKLETATGHVDELETACGQVQKLKAAGDLVTKLETAGDLVENMNVAGNYAEDMKMDGDNVEDANITGGDDDVYDFKSEDVDVHADDTQIQGTSGNALMDFEPIKADDDEQDIWDLPRKDGEQGHFLRHCTMSEVEVDEEHAGQEDGQPEEVEDDEEEDDEQVEGFDALQKCNSFSGLSSGHLMQAMDPSHMQYAASDFGDQASLGLLSSRGDNHLMLGGPSSIFGSAPKRELEHDPEMPGHFLNDSHKRMRTEGPPADFDMCFDQMQQWLEKARMAYMSSQNAMVSQQQMISYELENKDHIIQQLKLSIEEQQRRHQAELARYDNELYAMNSVISGYRKALKSTQQNFAEYRKRAALPLEPLYKDAGVGGVVKSVADLEKERLKREEEDRVALITLKSTALKLEEECSQTFKAHLERVEMLQARVPDIEKGVELIRESMRKRREASETVG